MTTGVNVSGRSSVDEGVGVEGVVGVSTDGSVCVAEVGAVE